MNDSKNRRFRDRTSGAPTLISEGCKISGVITGSGDYQVSGEVDGDCDIDGTVTLAHNGFWGEWKSRNPQKYRAPLPARQLPSQKVQWWKAL